jgi:hypothetical protein
MKRFWSRVRSTWHRVSYGTKVIAVVGLAGGVWQGWIAFVTAVLMVVALVSLDLSSKT